MLGSMISTRFMTCLAAGALYWAVSCLAETRNPYVGIVDRNPFGLKPPPPPVIETNQEPVAPPPNVKLTGISNLFARRALLEVTEQQAPARPGHPPPPGGNVNRPILGEGEAAFGVEVLAIDLEKNVVKIRNGGTESELTFEVPKPSGGGPTPVPAPAAMGRTASMAAPAMAQPTIVSSAEPRGGITMLGGGSGFAGNAGGVSSYGATSTATPMGNNNNRGISTYGGMPMTGNPSLAPNQGLRGIPSRTIRTPNVVEAPPVDRDTQTILIEANRLNSGPDAPPLPPTDLTPHMQGDGSGAGAPKFPAFPGAR